MIDETALMADIELAESEDPCPLCEFIGAIETDSVREAFSAAAGGTIGYRKLEHILRNQGSPIGRRTIFRHRNEAHTP